MNYINFGIATALFKLGFFKEAVAYDPNVIARLLQEPNPEPWQMDAATRSKQINQEAERLRAQLQAKRGLQTARLPNPSVDPLGHTALAPMPTALPQQGTRVLRPPGAAAQRLKQLLRLAPKG